MTQSNWFPAAAWVAFVLVPWVPVEIFCIVTHRRLISEVAWYLVANYTWQVAAFLGIVFAHFLTQSAAVYARYKTPTDKTKL
jgi:hypothetical protein